MAKGKISPAGLKRQAEYVAVCEDRLANLAVQKLRLMARGQDPDLDFSGDESEA